MEKYFLSVFRPVSPFSFNRGKTGVFAGSNFSAKQRSESSPQGIKASVSGVFNIVYPYLSFDSKCVLRLWWSGKKTYMSKKVIFSCNPTFAATAGDFFRGAPGLKPLCEGLVKIFVHPKILKSRILAKPKTLLS